jgi:hypothetical protein
MDMFLENKYTKWYKNIITKRIAEPLDKSKVYCERHHIIPKSLGGNNEPENLVNLLPREHFICHILLTKMLTGEAKKKMGWALHRCRFSTNGGEECIENLRTSRNYAYLRLMHISFLKEFHPSKTEGWITSVRNQVLSHWENNIERRTNAGRVFKKSHDERKINDPEYYSKQTASAKLGGIASREKMATRIEYLGKTYLGWSEFYRETGITKELYQKLYLNGIDPNLKKGKGYIRIDITRSILDQYLSKDGKPFPEEVSDIEKLLEESLNVGILTKSEVRQYMKEIKGRSCA